MANNLDVLDVAVGGTFQTNEEIVAAYQFRLNDIGGLNDALVLEDMEALVNALYAIVRALLVAATVIRTIRVANKTQGTLLGDIVLGTPIAGTGGASAVAPGVAALASFPTNIPRVTGRKFWGPLSTAVVDGNGFIGASSLVNMNSAIAYLIAPITPGNGTYQYGYDSPKAGGFVAFTEGQAFAEPAYQRRRRRGTGS